MAGWKDSKRKKIQEVLQKPDEAKGESTEAIADDLFPSEIVDYEETVPELLEQDEEKGEELITMTDDIPFLSNPKFHSRKESES